MENQPMCLEELNERECDVLRERALLEIDSRDAFESLRRARCERERLDALAVLDDVQHEFEALRARARGVVA